MLKSSAGESGGVGIRHERDGCRVVVCAPRCDQHHARAELMDAEAKLPQLDIRNISTCLELGTVVHSFCSVVMLCVLYLSPTA